MSKVMNDSLRESKIVRESLWRAGLIHSRSPIIQKEKAVVADCFTLWYGLTMDVVTRYGLAFSTKRWLNAILSSPIDISISTCKDADTLILQSLEIGVPNSYESLKQILKGLGHANLQLLGQLKGLIARTLENPEIYLKACRDVLLFPSKLNLTLECLSEDALTKYLANETSIKIDGFTTEEHALLRSCFPVTDQYEFESMIEPKHGSGSTSIGKLSVEEKYDFLSSDALYDYWFSHGPFEGLRAFGSHGVLRRIARVSFVPKNFKTYRTISMEPPTNMYWQEGIFEGFKAMLKGKWRWFSRYYDPRTQEPNRRLALKGSIDGSYSTIDLSSASDSVSWNLVRSWFPGTALYRGLAVTRSSRAMLPNGDILLLKKFAPMGSAVNFMVEVLVFWAITWCAIASTGADPRKVNFQVYGDDIVVPAQYYYVVCERLIANGFTVNEDKSYNLGFRGFFRESCGLHAYNGIDVTPLTVSRQFKGYTFITADTLDEAIALANAFYCQGYKRARYIIVDKLIHMPKSLRPRFGAEEGAVRSDNPTNSHLRSRYNEDLQREELLVGSIRTPSPSKGDQELCLYEFLRTTAHRERLGEPCVISVAPTKKPKLVSSWI